MDETIAIATMDERLAGILRRVRTGQTFVVIADGEPVARIVPAAGPVEGAEAARLALLTDLRTKPRRIIGANWTRDDLYDV